VCIIIFLCSLCFLILVLLMVNVTIRGVRDDVYRVFKAKAALRGISVQKALEEAIKLWIKSFDEEFSSRDVDDVVRFLRENPAEPFVFGKEEKFDLRVGREWARKKLGLKR